MGSSNQRFVVSIVLPDSYRCPILGLVSEREEEEGEEEREREMEREREQAMDG